MVRARARHPFKRAAEERFPHKVDIPVPGDGLGGQLSAMLTWCCERVPVGVWAQHGHVDRKIRDERGITIDFAPFYFLEETDAEAFRRRWLPGMAQKP